jgi:hypothetical protein
MPQINSNMKQFWEDKSRESGSILSAIEGLEKKGYSLFSGDENDNRFDLKVKKDNKEYKVEVKQDFTCFNTNNVGIEYSCRGKDSGIMVSKADMLIMKIHQNPKRAIVAKNEKSVNDIKVLRVTKKKLKNVITAILSLEDEIRGKEEYAREIGATIKNSRVRGTKRDFFVYKTKDGKDIEYRLVNGGDTGSASLNVLFKREEFMENFCQESFEHRTATQQEINDRVSSLNTRR